jgi:hypothetical protein
MSKKNLLIIAVLLVAIAAFVQLYSKRDRRQGDSPVGKAIASVGLVEKIDNISINKGDKTIHFQKQADRWVTVEKNMFPVDMEELLKLLDNITSYRIASLVTSDENRFPDFKLTKASGGITLTLKSGDKDVFHMVVGKNRASASTGNAAPGRPDGTYIKIGDQKAVFLIKENLDIEADINSWIKKTLFSLARKQVKSLRLESPSAQLSFSREDAKSDLSLAGLAKTEVQNQQPVKNLLEELESFEISDALAPKDISEKELQLKSAITVGLFDGSTLGFRILVKSKKNPLAENKEDKEELTYYVKLVELNPAEKNASWGQLEELGKKWLFEIDDWRAENWLKARKDYIKSTKQP